MSYFSLPRLHIFWMDYGTVIITQHQKLEHLEKPRDLSILSYPYYIRLSKVP